MSKWVSVKDKLPPKPAFKEKGYIVQVDNITEPFSAYWDGTKWTDDEDDYLYGVIAWQPLPEPYRERLVKVITDKLVELGGE
jgi:hypothetical protein